MKTVGVEFKKDGKQYLFYDDNFKVNIGDNVIVDTERGEQFATVCAIYDDDNKEHSKIVKIATKEDERQNNINQKEAKRALFSRQ